MNYEKYLVAIAIAKCKCASSQVPCFWATKKKFKGSTKTTTWCNVTNWTIYCYWNGFKELHVRSIGYNFKATTTYSFHIKLNDVYEKLQTWLVIEINTNSKVVTYLIRHLMVNPCSIGTPNISLVQCVDFHLKLLLSLHLT